MRYYPRTIHERVACDALLKHSDRDPNLLGTLAETRSRLCAGFYDERQVNVFRQTHFGTWNDHELYCFIRLWGAIQAGDILYCAIPLGVEPVGDRYLEENQRRLDEGLERASVAVSNVEKHLVRFHGHVVNGPSHSHDGSDGGVGWHPGAITVESAGHECEYVRHSLSCLHRDHAYSLEIGYQRISKTFVYLRAGYYPFRVLLRWPYGSDCLHVLYAKTWDEEIKEMLRKAPDAGLRRVIESCQRI